MCILTTLPSKPHAPHTFPEGSSPAGAGAMLSTHPLPGLAIDFPESKLYWVSSGNHTINRCNLDGSGLEIIDTMRNQLGKATALAIMGEGHRVGAGTGASQARLGWLGRQELAGGQPAQPARPFGRTGWEGGGPSHMSHPACCSRRQAVVGRSGVREDGHVQQG